MKRADLIEHILSCLILVCVLLLVGVLGYGLAQWLVDLRPRHELVRQLDWASAKPTYVPRTQIDAGALFELGKQTARLEAERERVEAVLERVEAEQERASAELFELEQVVYFSDCIERRSGKPFEIAFEREKYAKACRAETLGMTPVQISAAAKAIVDGSKAP